MTPTTFMTYSMAVDPRKSVVVTWTPIKRYSTPQGSQPLSRDNKDHGEVDIRESLF